ncbi:MAG: hypothetical protein H7Z16_08570 [Pyrinomonadaceae bacterium]|nr:hypothetical protein [Pyrinomonadaceae bacterium]
MPRFNRHASPNQGTSASTVRSLRRVLPTVRHSQPGSYKRVGMVFVALVICAAATAIFFYSRARAATTYTWNQTGTASWATSTNWSPARSTLAADDILIFNNGATTTVTNVPTETIGQLSVSLNTTVNLQAAAPVTLTIAGGGGTDLDLQAGSALNCNTTNAITIAVGTGATGSVFGSMTFSASAGTGHRLTSADASGITFNSGSVFTQGTNTTGNVFGSTGAPNTILFAAGSTFSQQAGANPLAWVNQVQRLSFKLAACSALRLQESPRHSPAGSTRISS